MPLEPIEEKELDLGAKFGHPSETPHPEKEALAVVEEPVVKEGVAAEQDQAYSRILSQVQSQANPDPAADVSADAQKVSELTDAESQVKHLVEIAVQSGVAHAVKVAQHLQNNYILDTFHDRLLSEELHGALVQKGLIKEI